jgi:transketolase
MLKVSYGALPTLTAAHYKLDNLCAIIDHNKLQISGTTEEICNTSPIDSKFESFRKKSFVRQYNIPLVHELVGKEIVIADDAFIFCICKPVILL